MSEMNDGGPAFPGKWTEHGITGPFEAEANGMSLRDWFAGQALASRGKWKEVHPAHRLAVANDCYAMADAMLVARGSKP